jgi:hypothetical protein
MSEISMGPPARLGRVGRTSKTASRFPEASKNGRFYAAADSIAGRFLGAARRRAEYDTGFVAFLLGRARPRPS